MRCSSHMKYAPRSRPSHELHKPTSVSVLLYPTITFQSVLMQCPLCEEDLKQHLLSTTQAMVSCPNKSCVYPFNLSMEEIWENGHIMQTNEQQIMQQMLPKLQDAGIEDKVSKFIVHHG